MGYELCSLDDFSAFLLSAPHPLPQITVSRDLSEKLGFQTIVVKYLRNFFYRPPTFIGLIDGHFVSM
jgi:hypothetical protein